MSLSSVAVKVLAPLVFSLSATGQLCKPVLVITITDGEPTDSPKDAVVKVGVRLRGGGWRG